jgi:hypothetical protein
MQNSLIIVPYVCSNDNILLLSKSVYFQLSRLPDFDNNNFNLDWYKQNMTGQVTPIFFFN